MGYHVNKIDKGTLGEFSKIKEEFQELQDAHEQNHNVLQICEMCDLVGAIELYAEKFNLSLDDIIKMKESNKAAFLSGKRK